jgi:hypothetical protein
MERHHRQSDPFFSQSLAMIQETQQLLIAAACIALAPATTFAGDVHVVDLSGSADFTTLQAAVNAAAGGDTILVNGGNYTASTGGASALIVGKSLNIAQGAGGQPELYGTLEIQGLASNQEVHVQGLFAREVVVSQSAGHVLLEDMNQGAGWFQECSLEVLASQNVTSTSSLFNGYNGWDSCGGQCNNGADGGTALRVVDSRVNLYHCSVTGGLGEDGAWLPCGIGGNGGDALQVTGSSSQVRHMGTSFTGGLEGLGGCGDGWIGSDISAPPGTVFQLNTPTSTLSGPAVASGGSTVDMVLTGPPGASVFLLTTTNLRHRYLSLNSGTLHMLSFTYEVLPPMPPSGVMVHQVAIPPLPPAEGARWRMLQAVFHQGGPRILSPPRGLTVTQ